MDIWLKVVSYFLRNRKMGPLNEALAVHPVLYFCDRVWLHSGIAFAVEVSSRNSLLGTVRIRCLDTYLARPLAVDWAATQRNHWRIQ